MTNIDPRYNEVSKEYERLRVLARTACSMARTAQRGGWDEDARSYMSAFRELSILAKKAHTVMESMKGDQC
jgi:hypothetical protein